jgi:DNA-binding transcriptional LysR family regulator
MASRLTDPQALLRLRTRQLLLVAQLGRERHLGRAAAALGVSQPAATKLLQQAEDTLGQPLFTRLARGPRGMAPTDSGEALIRFAAQMLTDFGVTRETMRSLDAGLQGRLRLGSVPGAMPNLVAPALAGFRRTHPGVSVHLDVATSDLMLERLALGEVDLVLGRLTDRSDADAFDATPLLAEPQVVVVRGGHPLTRRGARVDLAALARLAWVLQPPGSPQRTRFEDALREAGLQTRLDIMETASTVATTALLEQSDMATVMPASLARHYGRLGVLAVLRFELPMKVPAVHLIRRRARWLSPAAEAFAQAVQAQAASGASRSAAR